MPTRWFLPTSWPAPCDARPVRWSWPAVSPREPTWSSTASGSSESVTHALAMVRPRGRVVLVGMPGRISIDLAPLWHRELALVGAYAYGAESPVDGAAPRRSFELAIELVAGAGLGSLVSAAYPIERYEEAIAHAGAAGRRGAVKVVFDLRGRKRDPKGAPR